MLSLLISSILGGMRLYKIKQNKVILYKIDKGLLGQKGERR